MSDDVVMRIPFGPDSALFIGWPEILAIGGCCLLPLLVAAAALVGLFSAVRRKS